MPLASPCSACAGASDNHAQEAHTARSEINAGRADPTVDAWPLPGEGEPHHPTVADVHALLMRHDSSCEYLSSTSLDGERKLVSHRHGRHLVGDVKGGVRAAND